jgi:hypothetical protein
MLQMGDVMKESSQIAWTFAQRSGTAAPDLSDQSTTDPRLPLLAARGGVFVCLFVCLFARRRCPFRCINSSQPRAHLRGVVAIGGSRGMVTSRNTLRNPLYPNTPTLTKQCLPVPQSVHAGASGERPACVRRSFLREKVEEGKAAPSAADWFDKHGVHIHVTRRIRRTAHPSGAPRTRHAAAMAA